MASDPRKLRPGELCQLLNSTPLGEVIGERQLHRHRTRAGLRIGDGRSVDLPRYVAWLVQVRHAPDGEPAAATATDPDLAAAARGAAALAAWQLHPKGHGQKPAAKRESLIAALLTEPTHAAAAAKAGVSEATVYRWLKLPDFRAAYRQARRELVEAAIGRIQAATGQAVEALTHVARRGRRDSERVRAAIALLNHAFRGLSDAHLLDGKPEARDDSPIDTDEVVRLLAGRLRQLDESQLPAAEKSRLTAMLSDSLLRAFGVAELDQRLEALQDVLLSRKTDKKKR